MGRATDLNAFAGKLGLISSVHFVSRATLTGRVGGYMHEGRVVTKRFLRHTGDNQRGRGS